MNNYIKNFENNNVCFVKSEVHDALKTMVTIRNTSLYNEFEEIHICAFQT